MRVSVGTIKHHATGKGNASKQDVISSLQAKGYHPRDDNEAGRSSSFRVGTDSANQLSYII
jgi:hypothetical protein